MTIIVLVLIALIIFKKSVSSVKEMVSDEIAQARIEQLRNFNDEVDEDEVATLKSPTEMLEEMKKKQKLLKKQLRKSK